MTRWALLTLMALLLAACAGAPVRPIAGIDWDARAARLAAHSDWRAQGRIAVRSGKDGGQGSLVWRQSADGAQVLVSGPFGAGGWQIDWNDTQIAVTSKDGRHAGTLRGPDAADRFIAQQLGWSFPARSIRYWMLGIADPAFDAHAIYDEAGWLQRIEQNGWVIEYDRFDPVEETWLPHRITMENDRARVKVVVDDWRW